LIESPRTCLGTGDDAATKLPLVGLARARVYASASVTARAAGYACASEPPLTASSGRGIAYLRVSTESQADSGLGLEAQQTAIESAAARLGLTLAQTFTDAGVSGGLALEQRPALLAALDAIRAGDLLLVAKRDRLGRDVLNVAMIERLVERRGARVYSAAGEGTDDDTPTGKLMRQIIDAFAEYERALIRARTRAAMAAAKKTRPARGPHPVRHGAWRGRPHARAESLRTRHACRDPSAAEQGMGAGVDC
jgi:DNA invertase Pin-like site-specific DNA recombinase